MTIDQVQARAHLDALTGGFGASAIIDWRVIHDKRADVPAIVIRGTFDECAAALNYYQSEGYGAFLCVNETDGHGVELSHITGIRAQFVDLDKDDAPQRYQQAVQWALPPTFAVISSPGRAHLYWTVCHAEPQRFTAIQRRLAVMFNGDTSCVDPTRVLRLAGSLNQKRQQPTICTFQALTGQPVTPDGLEFYLSGVTVSDAGPSTTALGEGIAAPSLEWAGYALSMLDPNQMPRSEWLKVTAAFKASAWQFGEPIVRIMWDAWSAQYVGNDPAENEKLWRSINETKVGWNYLTRSSGVAAELAFGRADTRPGEVYERNKPITPSGLIPHANGVSAPASVALNTPPMPSVSEPAPRFNWLLTPQDQARYFTGCTFVEKDGLILTPSGRLMSPQKFNGAFGGHEFVISDDGKSTDEPWKAATRGKVFRIENVDHLRFLPRSEPGTIIIDELHRKGINTYRPASVRLVDGDPSPFLQHLRRILPTDRDYQILINYLAHCAQRPGYKIPWAPVIQSVEGAGKGAIDLVMRHAVGSVYYHAPNAKELTEGGGKFNAWMRAKLFILCNEIKVDDRRDLMEVLKPMISEDRIEIQAKGSDQEFEDNAANWIFFTNYKDAVPIDKSSRRYAIIYSTMQSPEHLQSAGMNARYFSDFYDWLKGDGAAIVCNFLMHHQIVAEYDPWLHQRAPATSSRDEAIIMSRGRIEQLIADAAEANEPGFRGGWCSTTALMRKIKDEGMRSVGPLTLKRALEAMGYHQIGRAARAYIQEDGRQPSLWSVTVGADVSQYAAAQGYAV